MKIDKRNYNCDNRIRINNAVSMLEREIEIIRRKNVPLKIFCPFCKKSFFSFLPSCPHCHKKTGIKYYFEKEELIDKTKEIGMKEKIDYIEKFRQKMTELQAIFQEIHKEYNIYFIKEKSPLAIKETNSSHLRTEEGWISPAKFSYETQICQPGSLLRLFKKDPVFFETCARKEGRKIYIKKNLVIDYLKTYAEGRLLAAVMRYYNRKRENLE